MIVLPGQFIIPAPAVMRLHSLNFMRRHFSSITPDRSHTARCPDLGGKISVVFVVAKLMAAPACALLIVIASLSRGNSSSEVITPGQPGQILITDSGHRQEARATIPSYPVKKLFKGQNDLFPLKLLRKVGGFSVSEVPLHQPIKGLFLWR